MKENELKEYYSNKKRFLIGTQTQEILVKNKPLFEIHQDNPYNLVDKDMKIRRPELKSGFKDMIMRKTLVDYVQKQLLELNTNNAKKIVADKLRNGINPGLVAPSQTIFDCSLGSNQDCDAQVKASNQKTEKASSILTTYACPGSKITCEENVKLKSSNSDVRLAQVPERPDHTSLIWDRPDDIVESTTNNFSPKTFIDKQFDDMELRINKEIEDIDIQITRPDKLPEGVTVEDLNSRKESLVRSRIQDENNICERKCKIYDRIAI